jgi:hypothetical protein
MQGTQRTQNLSLDLDYVFKTHKIVKIWKNTVRQGLRKQSLEYLHNFLDIHKNIQSLI